MLLSSVRDKNAHMHNSRSRVYSVFESTTVTYWKLSTHLCTESVG